MRYGVIAILTLGIAGYTGYRFLWTPGQAVPPPSPSAPGAGPATPRPPSDSGPSGTSLMAQGEFAKAQPALQRELRAAEAAGDRTVLSRTLLLLAQCCLQLKKDADAEACWRRFLQEFPDDPLCADVAWELGSRTSSADDRRRFLLETLRFPESEAARRAALPLYEEALRDRDESAARKFGTVALRGPLEAAKAAEIKTRLAEMNARWLRGGQDGPDSTTVTVVSGDTLGKIAKDHKTTVGLIKRINGLRGDMIRIGQTLTVLKGTFHVEVNRTTFRLVLYYNGEFFKEYVVGVGKVETPSPVGTFTIKGKLTDPPWITSGKVIPPGDPANLLGTRWMGFAEKPSFGIHGILAAQDATVGSPSSNGCVRMHNADVEELYDFLPDGTKIFIHD